MEILYVDQWMIVVNKPSGLLSIQDGYDLKLPHIRTKIEPSYGKCWIVHRLDKETSGVLVLARTKESHRAISLLFDHREVKKTYYAIVYGEIEEKQMVLDFPLRINGDRKHRTIVDPENGKEARTTINLMRTNRNISEITALPQTGYTHQIRAHLAYIGHPILGDSLYFRDIVSNVDPNLINRLALHAYSIALIHPFSKKLLEINAQLPSDFLEIESLVK